MRYRIFYSFLKKVVVLLSFGETHKYKSHH